MYMRFGNRDEAIGFQTSVNANRVCQAMNRETYKEQTFRVVPNGALYHIFDDASCSFVTDYEFDD